MDLQVQLIKIVSEEFTVNSFDISQDGLYLYLVVMNQDRFIEF